MLKEGVRVSAKWQKQSKYHIKNGAYTICKVKINGKFVYELWHGKEVLARGDLEAMKKRHLQEVK